MTTAPEHCRDMTELRAEIDRLDRMLVAMLATRQRYIERAAEIKQDRNVVRDEARIEDVVAKVLAEARKAGLDPKIAEPVWRLLIERCIAYEFERFDELKSVNT
ncbi:MAG TPA: chorismate mutase [Rhizomicrobium sp.]|nr:chorismate mutase [Rhizomicrobium sp.]